MSRPSRFAAALLTVSMGVLWSCGIPTQDDARRVGDDDVPFGILGSDSVPTTAAAGIDAVVYLTRGGRLVPTHRSLSPPDLDARLSALVAGPTENEAEQGLRSALLDDAIIGASAREGVVTIDLAKGFTDATPAEQRLAVAQLTYTVTEVVGIELASFRLEGRPISVPRADGTTSDGLVGRADYAQLGP